MATDDATHTTIVKSDEPVEIHVGDSTGWFRLWNNIVLSGKWAGISAGAKAVLVVLAQHADRHWVAFPGHSRIQRYAGIGRTQVKRAIRELQREGLVKIRGQGSGGTTATYQIVEPAGGSENRPGTENRPGRKSDQNRVGKPTPNQTKRIRQQQERRSAPQARGARNGATVPGPTAAADVIDALVRAGIGEPTRSELAALPHLTLRMVERISAQAQEHGKGPGAIVLDIRAANEKAQRDAERKRQHREAERRVQHDIAEQREQDQAEALTGDARKEALARGFAALNRRRI